MNKKILILLSCLFILLVACQYKEETIPNNQHTENNTLNNKHKDEDEVVDHITPPKASLEKGEETKDVKSLQQVLGLLDYPLEETGVYDDLTTWAVTDIQIQKELQISGMYDEATEETITNLLDDKESLTIGDGLEQPKHPDKYPETVENPYDVLALVNKEHALPSDYEPEDLVIPDVRFPYEEDVPKKYLRKIAADALEELIEAGDEDDVAIFGQSGFRSYDRQESIFASNTAKNGEEHANTYSARAGESEHQTGLVMDVTAQAVGFDLNTDFGETEEGKWIKEHAHDYGFIIRYPEEKEDITQYQFEPWHLRYVGPKAATEIHENDLSLEEYLGEA